jgi:hypothetical protein
MKRLRRCVYCGKIGQTTKEHVVPRCFYPPSKATSRVQRITIRACRPCNDGWADDEAHTKHVLLVAGEPNAAVQELWASALRAMTIHADGHRRLFDLAERLVPMTIDGRERHVIYPARDPRVVRVIRKIVRGLSAQHHIGTAVPDDRVWVDVLDPPPPPELLDSVELHHVERDIIEYWYDHSGEHPTIQSVWFVRLFERRNFVALVWRRDPADVARQNAQATTP